MSSQLQHPALFIPEATTVIPCIEGWVEPTICLDVLKRKIPFGEPNAALSSPQLGHCTNYASSVPKKVIKEIVWKVFAYLMLFIRCIFLELNTSTNLST
jgi:hypothetical protein